MRSTPITEGLRLRRVDVVTAQQDGASSLADPDLPDRATTQGRVLFTRDADLLIEAIRRQRAGLPFAGVIYAHQMQVTVGQCVGDLELLATTGEPADFASRVHFLPLR